MNKVFIGYDNRMPLAFAIANKSMARYASIPLQFEMLSLPQLQALGYYMRPTFKKDGNWFDMISNAPMATQFAISRFLVPMLSGYNGWAVFCDSDFMFRGDIAEVFAQADETKAVMVVKHKYDPGDGVKMDGQAQSSYPRKNWSSFILWNCGHPSNRHLDLTMVNSKTGRDLHGFCWLKDEEIGELNECWNWLEGHSTMDIEPKAVHFTRGTPDMPGYENVPYADEWRRFSEGMTACE